MSKDEITPAQLGIRVGRFTTTKYRSRRTWVEELERWFASAHEAEVAVGLWRRQQAGEIRDLKFQVPYDLIVEDEKVCRYVADFVWREDVPVVIENPYPTADGGRVEAAGWRQVVADAKSPPTRTALYRLKARLMKACWGITIVEL